MVVDHGRHELVREIRGPATGPAHKMDPGSIVRRSGSGHRFRCRIAAGSVLDRLDAEALQFLEVLLHRFDLLRTMALPPGDLTRDSKSVPRAE